MFCNIINIATATFDHFYKKCKKQKKKKNRSDPKFLCQRKFNFLKINYLKRSIVLCKFAPQVNLFCFNDVLMFIGKHYTITN